MYVGGMQVADCGLLLSFDIEMTPPTPPLFTIINPLCTEGDFCEQVNQSVRYVHSCLDTVIQIKMSTNNSSQKSAIVEYNAKRA